MDDYDNRFAPGYGTEFTRDTAQHQDVPRLALQEVPAQSAKPSYHAIRTGPPIADYRQKKKRRGPDMDGDLAVMICRGNA